MKSESAIEDKTLYVAVRKRFTRKK